MKIAFIGDSITEGIHGVSYVDIVKKEFPKYQIDNYGLGGDTVKSLLTRIKKLGNLNDYDLVFMMIGVNDLLGKLSLFYKILKVISKQPTTKDHKDFEKHYNLLVDYLLLNTKKLVVMPPLLIGENISNTWNKQLHVLVKAIEFNALKHSDINYLDVREPFIVKLKENTVSDYLPIKAMEMKHDGDFLKKNKSPELLSEKRELFTTIDGVHLNSLGANIISSRIISYLAKL